MTNQSGFMRINGAQLWYEDAGAGLPVVFIHAGIADSRMWDSQFAVFARRYRAIRFDMRGFGQSKMVAGPYSHRADLHALLRALGVDSAALIGVSLGGQTAIDFALEHPGKTAALIPVCSGLSGQGDEDAGELPPLIQEIIRADQAGDQERVNELEVQLWLDGLHREPGSVRAEVREKVLQMNRIALQTPPDLGQPQPLDPPAAGRLGEIQVPTLVIYGELDLPEINATAQLLGRAIPGAQVARIDGTAHLPNMEEPEQFNELVLGFLAQLPAISRF